MLENIKIGDVFAGSNGHFVVDNIYISKMQWWVETTHLESGTKTHTNYNTFIRCKLKKCDKKYLLRLELAELLEKNVDLDRIDKLTNMLEEED